LKNYLFYIVISLLSFSASSTNKDFESTLPSPSWVKPVVLNNEFSTPKEQLRDGIYYLLVDSQAKVDKEGEVIRYVRNVRKITNPSGVESSSQINISYDPSYQQMKIHSVVVKRNGVSIDKHITARISVLQQEEELDQLIYNGDETVNLVLDDIRVGDVLDYSFSIEGQNPVYDGIFSQSNYFQWTEPVLKRSVRILWQKNKKLQIKQHHQELEVKQTQLNSGLEYLVEKEQVQPLQTDGNTPSWFNKYPFIEFSESESWKEIINWSLPLFNNSISEDAAIIEIANNIALQTSTKQEQLAKALIYVQQEIRYLGIEIGENSHRPSLAQETLARRYGDCKDKTVLLISILKQLEIESYPALVNSRLGHETANRLPKPGAFDHVIVKALIDGKAYWVDPTRKYQNKELELIFQPDYKQTLVVSSQSNSLETPKVSFDNTFTNTTEEFKLTDDYTGKVTYSTSSEMSGYEAERIRSSLASKGLSKLKDEYLNYYKGFYTEMTVLDPLNITELDNGNIKTTENYEIDNFWEKNESSNKYNTWFYANTISSYLSRSNTKNRNDPLALSHPVDLRQTIKVSFSEDDWGFTDESASESNEFFDYSKSVSFDKGSRILTLDYKYKSKSSYVPSDKLASYDASLKKLDDDTTFGIYRKFSPASESENLSTTEEGFSTEYDTTYLTIVAVMILFYVFAIILWRVEAARNPYKGEINFYPVSIIKFMAMTLLTFGVYSSYWLYKNFKYIKVKSEESIMPIARGIFDRFWFYPLFSRLIDDSQLRYGENKLPAEFFGVILAVVYFIASIMSRTSDYLVLSLVISALVSLPLLIYVNRTNKENQEAITYNSKWSTRHVLMAVVSIPLLFLSLGAAVRVLPSDNVIHGSEILSYDLKYLQRKGVIEPSDEIEYFYSDAILFLRSDGSGFTDRHVFSYWINENDEFQLEKAEYRDIKDLQVTWSKSELDNTVIKVVLSEDWYFLLFASAGEKKDKIFVKQLRDNWNKYKN
jgi:transglutaminase-like putative cysteine protease